MKNRIRQSGWKGVLLAAVLFLLPAPLNAAATDSVTPAQVEPNGVYIVEVYKAGEWQEAGRLSFDKYFREREIALDQYLSTKKTAKIRLTQKGGGAAHIDSVLLGGMPPAKAKGSEDALALKKLSRKDYDVIDAFEKTIELTFAGPQKDKTLSLTARVESTVISKVPFQFPAVNPYRPMNEDSRFYSYQLSPWKGSVKPAGAFEDSSQQKPFFKEFSRTGSGHPSGFTYGWVRNDDKDLYVKIDFTPDNTMDGDKDYAKVYVMTNEGLKEFKVSVPETRWGSPDFTYTDKVAYQHKVYDFRIPLSELGVGDLNEEKALQLAFSAYGTAAQESADIGVVKTDSPDPVAVGGNITYNITVSNAGPDPAANINLSDPLPAGTKFVSLTQNTGPTMTCITPSVGGTGTISCTVANFVNGASAQLSVTITAPDTPGSVSNTATVSSTAQDLNPGNNSSTASTVVVPHYVTASSSGHGSINPEGALPADHNEALQFTLTPDPGYHIDSVTGTCGGNLVINTFTTSPVTTDCTVIANFALTTTVVIASATGQGNITLTTTSQGCGFFDVGVKTEEQVGYDPGFDYPYGIVTFKISCPSAVVTITFPGSIAVMSYRKYEPGLSWYDFTYDGTTGAEINGSQAILHFVDGGRGDGTGEVGIIVDDGGPGQTTAAIPAMNEWGLMIFGVLAGCAALYCLRRQRAATG